MKIKLPMDFMSSEKGKKIIIEDGFKFRFHKMLRNDVQRWKCYLNTCKCFFLNYRPL